MSDVGKINGTGPVNPNSQNQNVEQRRAEEEMPNSIMETSDTSVKDTLNDITELGQKLADKTLVGKMKNYLEENKDEVKEKFENAAKKGFEYTTAGHIKKVVDYVKENKEEIGEKIGKFGLAPFVITKIAKESNEPTLKELVETNGGPGGVLGMSVKDLHEDIDKYKKE